VIQSITPVANLVISAWLARQAIDVSIAVMTGTARLMHLNVSMKCVQPVTVPIIQDVEERLLDA